MSTEPPSKRWWVSRFKSFCTPPFPASMLHGDRELGVNAQGGGAEPQLDITSMMPAARFELADPAETIASQAPIVSTSAEPVSDHLGADSKEQSGDSAVAEAPSRSLRKTELGEPGAHSRPQQQQSASSGPAQSVAATEDSEEGEPQPEADTQVYCATCPSPATQSNAPGSQHACRDRFPSSNAEHDCVDCRVGQRRRHLLGGWSSKWQLRGSGRGALPPRLTSSRSCRKSRRRHLRCRL